MSLRFHFMFMVALFGSSSVYDLIGYYAATLPAHAAYFLGATVGGVVVGAVWVIAECKRGEQ